MHRILIAAISLVLAQAAFAGDNNCNGNNSCPQNTITNDNDTTTTNNTAAAVGVNTNIAGGGDASVKSSGNSFNVNDNDQSNRQSQKQSSSSGAVSAVSTSVVVERDRIPKQTASAASVAMGTSPIVCSMARGGSGQGADFGFSLIFGDDDGPCNARAWYAILSTTNPAMADAYACEADDDFRDAAAKLFEAGLPNPCYALKK